MGIWVKIIPEETGKQQLLPLPGVSACSGEDFS
jgi:hypothetical protein